MIGSSVFGGFKFRKSDIGQAPHQERAKIAPRQNGMRPVIDGTWAELPNKNDPTSRSVFEAAGHP